MDVALWTKKLHVSAPIQNITFYKKIKEKLYDIAPSVYVYTMLRLDEFYNNSFVKLH